MSRPNPADSLGVTIAIGDLVQVTSWGKNVRLYDTGRRANVEGFTRFGNAELTVDENDNDPIGSGRPVDPEFLTVLRRDGQSGWEGNRMDKTLKQASEERAAAVRGATWRDAEPADYYTDESTESSVLFHVEKWKPQYAGVAGQWNPVHVTEHRDEAVRMVREMHEDGAQARVVKAQVEVSRHVLSAGLPEHVRDWVRP